MTRDDILSIARAVGISDTDFDFQMVSPDDLERFAAIVAAAERKACAEICKDEAKRLAASADRMERRGYANQAGPVRGLAWKCNALKERIEDRGKP